MGSQTKKLILAISAIVSLGIIAIAIVSAQSSRRTPSVNTVAERDVTQAELAKNDGKDGTKCYVAVSGTVYEVSEDSPYWQNGSHTTSEGQASCGRDLTEAIKQAPHGTSKLDQLTTIGPLVD